MTVAYFDCFAGAGGDMIVASLISAGCSFEDLQKQLARLESHAGLSIQNVTRHGLSGLKFEVDAGDHHHPHRHLGDIIAMIDAAQLPPRAAQRAKAVFERLGAAEAKVHQCPIDHVHFHEVGAIDSIMDIVGACLAMEMLNIDRIICSPLPLGDGTVSSAHGIMPVPAPATAELLKGVPISQHNVKGEAVTPTAAAIFTTLAESFSSMPAMLVSAVGYGAGTREGDPLPGLLRVFLGDAQGGEGNADSLVELSANLDDTTGEIIADTLEKLLAGGCVDAWATPIVMKKSRPAWVLSALCAPADVSAAQEIIFRHTTTFGVRHRLCRRRKLLRRHVTVETPYGPLRVKVGSLDGKDITASPEFADCQRAAEAHHAAVRQVMAAAQKAFEDAK
ncbi:MAG: nickel pincer cofactor biosynthesis protein LarC [Planctomycetes bacterium]|jgi:uncharacterized protein (TIGR00299 family) protein|nr:nickel pincer cofactor biosynthesis protein LarC [Planctomycetota bacterium]